MHCARRLQPRLPARFNEVLLRLCLVLGSCARCHRSTGAHKGRPYRVGIFLCQCWFHSAKKKPSGLTLLDGFGE